MNCEIFYRKRHAKRWLKPSTYWWKLKSKIKWVFNGFKHKAISLKDYEPKPEWTKYKNTFKRLQSETDPVKWKWLADTCNTNDFKICISSVWKNHFEDPNEWKRALTELGFKEGTCVGITGNRRTLRGTEIQEFLDTIDYDNYAILDDDSDMLPEQKANGHFFQVDSYYGISPTMCYRVEYFLNNK